MGVKGDWQRPFTVSKAERDLRHLRAFGKITEEEFEVKLRDLNETQTP